MENVYLYRGKRPSQGGRAVGEALGATVVKCKNANYALRNGHTVINWGNSGRIPGLLYDRRLVKIINDPDYVRVAANKLHTFVMLKAANVSVPEYTTTKHGVIDLDNGDTWFARTKLNGSAGAGIVIFKPRVDIIPDAPLYTKYIPAEYEVRVHAAKGPRGAYCFSFQQKLKKRDAPKDDGMIKNHDKGYVFVRNALTIPWNDRKACELEGEKALNALDLDFGAVDIIYANGKAYVLEVNTSPGVEGTTLDDYVAMLKGLING